MIKIFRGLCILLNKDKNAEQCDPDVKSGQAATKVS